MTAKKSDARNWLRFVAVVSAILVLADMAVRNILPQHAQGLLDGFISIEIDPLIVDWISLVAWPIVPVAGIALWVAPYVKQRRDETRVFAQASFILLAVGCLLDAAGRMVYSQPIIGNGLGLAGALAQLAGAIVYLGGVWRAVSRPLVPSVVDLMLQLGALWLLAATGLHFAFNLGLTLDNEGKEYLRAFIAVYTCFGLGFLVNTGLWLMHSLLPRFLGMGELRGRSLRGMLFFNIIVFGWGLGTAWSVQFPYTWVRLPLALVSLALPVVTIYLIRDVGLLQVFGAKAPDARRRLARVAAVTALIGAVGAAALAGGVGFWLGASSEVILPSAADAVRDAMRLGLGSNLVLALLVCLLGTRALGGGSIGLVWVAFALNILGLVGLLGLQVASPLTALDLTGLLGYGDWVVGVAHGLWGLWVIVSAPRT